ncbi:uncharacterized protein LOC105310199 [Pteropus vampyrus]|uniref:Uncharacterized protein LOC105310199 n=1 Tax=Pteropus vampyrus TaxID=132908 RepID=A0A6P3S3S3_PTEVA|nr:uncharacterized protein LOC105310199 [Pteropus vampyrus]
MVAPAWAPRCQEKGVGLDVREDQASLVIPPGINSPETKMQTHPQGRKRGCEHPSPKAQTHPAHNLGGDPVGRSHEASSPSRRLTWIPPGAQPERLHRSDEHRRTLQNTAGAGLRQAGPITARQRRPAPPSGPGGPQLPHCHPCLSVTRRPPCTGGDGGWTETQAEVLASRQLYWFSVCAFLSRGPAQRLPRVQLPHQINQHAIAQRGVEQHQLAPREGVYQPRRPLEVPAGSAVPAAAQRQGELQDFQDSCGRNEHGIRAQYWGPAIYIQPACTLSKRTLQGLCYAPYCTWTWTFELSDDSMSRFPSQKLVWRN